MYGGNMWGSFRYPDQIKDFCVIVSNEKTLAFLLSLRVLGFLLCTACAINLMHFFYSVLQPIAREIVHLCGMSLLQVLKAAYRMSSLIE